MRHFSPIYFTRGCAKSDCFRREPNEREGADLLLQQIWRMIVIMQKHARPEIVRPSC